MRNSCVLVTCITYPFGIVVRHTFNAHVFLPARRFSVCTTLSQCTASRQLFLGCGFSWHWQTARWNRKKHDGWGGSWYTRIPELYEREYIVERTAVVEILLRSMLSWDKLWHLSKWQCVVLARLVCLICNGTIFQTNKQDWSRTFYIVVNLKVHVWEEQIVTCSLFLIQQESTNYDDSGFFSIQVLQQALRVWDLELIPYSSSTDSARQAREDPR